MRKQIVHNLHVVRDLETRGAVFVDELDEVPEGATVVFSAHGVAPSVHAEARTRALRVVDATCPLVTKVHQEARKFAAKGYDIVLISHEGTRRSSAPWATRLGAHLVGDEEEAAQVEVADSGRVAYLLNTLSVDETARSSTTLQERFPGAGRPPLRRHLLHAEPTGRGQDPGRRMPAGPGHRGHQLLNSVRLVEVARAAGLGLPGLGGRGGGPGLVRGRHRRHRLGRLALVAGRPARRGAA